MAAEPDVEAKGTDPLKIYCWIFVLLVIALGVLYVKRHNDRKALEAANALAEQWFDPKLPRSTRDDRPNDIPTLAFEVEQLVEAYVAAGGEDVAKISPTKMKALATQAGMDELHVGNENLDPNHSKGYSTLTIVYDYQNATLDNLVRLAYNVDASARYRVMEIRWQMVPERENTAAPFHKIMHPQLKIALRTAISKSS